MARLDDAGLKAALGEAGKFLPSRMDAYIFGGGAMVFRNQKASTKDVDVVFETVGDAKSFAQALKSIGFTQDRKLEGPYDLMQAAGGVWLRSDSRFDVFAKKVCGALSLSPTVKKRSVPFGNYGNLATHLFSNEDLVLFKAITERPGDLDDVASIVRTATVDWSVILEECKSQSLGRYWYGAVYNKLVELSREPYRIDAPIQEELRRLDEISILKESYEMRLKKGMARKQAIAELKKEGASESELRQATA
ncbi:hypothetical protein HY095_02790 [Candidatus Micrarchaeota archaeon]|nr:hypothetical protein [Candidatus Micrarchaeota archaeon]